MIEALEAFPPSLKINFNKISINFSFYGKMNLTYHGEKNGQDRRAKGAGFSGDI